MTEQIKGAVLVIAGVIVGGLLFAVFGSNGNLGGVYSNVQKDFAEGITVDGTVVIDGDGNVDAPITTTSITNSGTFSNTGTASIIATSTLSDTVNFNNPGICINFYATSTATRVHMIASSTAAINGSSGIMLFDYGACAL